MELITITGATLSSSVGGVVTILPASVTTPFLAVDEKKPYAVIAFTVTYTTYTGVGTITGNSIETSVDGVALVLSTAKAVGVILTDPNTGATVTTDVTISNAGQTVAYCD